MHDFARGIADKFARTQRNFRALLRSDAHGENADAVGRRLPRGFESVGVEFLAIGNNNNGAGKSFCFAKGLFAGADGRGNVRSAFRDEIGVEFVHRGEHRPVIKG